MRDAYSLEFPVVNLASESETAHEVSIFSAVIYAFAVSVSESYCALSFAAILPALLLIKKRVSLLKVNVMNLIMIITLALTWPVISEGVLVGIKIALRVNMIYVVFAVLVLPLGISAVYSLPIPEKLRVLLLLTIRGIFILSERMEKAIISVRLRAPKVKGIMRLKVFAYIVGSVLLQGASKSERMLLAVETRGGFGGFGQAEDRRFSVRDKALLILGVGYGAVIVLMNYA